MTLKLTIELRDGERVEFLRLQPVEVKGQDFNRAIEESLNQVKAKREDPHHD